MSTVTERLPLMFSRLHHFSGMLCDCELHFVATALLVEQLGFFPWDAVDDKILHYAPWCLSEMNPSSSLKDKFKWCTKLKNLNVASSPFDVRWFATSSHLRPTWPPRWRWTVTKLRQNENQFVTFDINAQAGASPGNCWDTCQRGQC